MFVGNEELQAFRLEAPKEPQNSNYRNHHSGQRCSHSNPPDRLFLEGIEPLAEPGELSLHPVASVLPTDNDFERQEATVELGKAVADGFSAQVAAIGQIVEWVAHCPTDSLA